MHMRIQFETRHHGEIEFGIIYGGITVLALTALRTMPIAKYMPACVFKGVTGIPCPTCGATRSALFLSHGDLPASFGMNPLISAVLLGAGFYFLYSTVAYFLKLPRVIVTLSAYEQRVARIGVIVIVVANWMYLLLTR